MQEEYALGAEATTKTDVSLARIERVQQMVDEFDASTR